VAQNEPPEKIHGQGFSPLMDEYATFYRAAQAGDLILLQHLRAQQPPFPWDEMTCAIAAYAGHLHVLQWLRRCEPPCPWDVRTWNHAAIGGHIHVLQWLREQNPPWPWDEYTCTIAAKLGHLDLLQWLRSCRPPCPWAEWTCDETASQGHWHILQWLLEQHPPCPWAPWDSASGTYEMDRIGQFDACQRLTARHGLKLSANVAQWLRAVQDTLHHHLPTFLCHDVITLVQRYV